jgi:uncharacterized coiled-coil DUF342 family protein
MEHNHQEVAEALELLAARRDWLNDEVNDLVDRVNDLQDEIDELRDQLADCQCGGLGEEP